MKIRLYVISQMVILLLFTQCFTISYNTKGGQPDPLIKTVSVQYFANRATRVNPTLSQDFTDALKDYLESSTKLRVVNTIGDIDFSGEIKDYKISLEAIAAGDVASKTRFTITIRVKFTSYIDTEDNYDTSFSAFRTFDSNISFTSVEEQYTKEIIDELLDKIYNQTFVNW